MPDDRRPRLRGASSSDAPEIAALHCTSALAAFRGIFPPTVPKPTPATLHPGWVELLKDEEATVLVAESTTIVGCVVVRSEAGVPSGIVLDRLHVDPPRRRRRIGSMVHDAAQRVAAEQEVRSIDLWVLEENLPARAMYERRGWRLVPGWTRPNDPPTVVDVLYERTLAPPVHDRAATP